MKVCRWVALPVLAALVFSACASSGAARGGAQDGGMDITARGAIGRVEGAAGPVYSGDGGSSIQLAVLAPEVRGQVPDYLPLYIQGLLNNNISRFSSIKLIDRQNLNSIIAQQDLASNGRFSDEDFIRIGNLTNARYFLFGSIQNIGANLFSLQLSVTDASTGVIKATFM